MSTTKKAIAQVFGAMRGCRIALEVGMHSPWVSRLLWALGHEVVVANPRQVKLISASSRKDDRMDAQTLARLARVDLQLPRPIQHRSEKAQADLMVIRVRAALVEARTSLVNTARGLAKSLGERLPLCDTDQMGVEQTESLPAELQQVLQPLLKEVVSLTVLPTKLLLPLRARVFACFTPPFDPGEIANLALGAASDSQGRDDMQILSAKPGWVSVGVSCRLI